MFWVRNKVGDPRVGSKEQDPRIRIQGTDRNMWLSGCIAGRNVQRKTSEREELMQGSAASARIFSS